MVGTASQDFSQFAVPLTVAAETQLQSKRAKKLATDLHLPFVEFHQAPAGYLLLVRERQLELHSSSEPPIHGPIFVDYVSGKAAHRQEFGGGRRQHLARAVGIKAGFNPTIIDATAGLGSDAFVLATLGCKIRMIEHCLPVVQLLEDGLLRARGSAATVEIANRMQLHNGDALELIPLLAKKEYPDVIYLDPMYPPRNKSAAVKKEMQMLQLLAGKGGDNKALLQCALQHAGKRVVVKRPVWASAIGDSVAHACVESTNTRYDIYLPIREI
jgi:16S rRNA (guanine1516-N2)-methyltransferase